LRLLLRAPGFTLVAGLTLALGVGANTAIFSVVRAVLLAPLPFADPDRLVSVWHAYPPSLPRAVSAPGFDDLRQARHIFDDVTVFSLTNQNLTGGGEPERLVVARVSQSFQPVLGVHVAIGRWFTADEDAPNQNRVVVLSDAVWRRRLGGDPSVVGRTISLNDVPHRVIGVMAPAGTFPRATDVWVPIAFSPEQRGPGGRGTEYLDAITADGVGERLHAHDRWDWNRRRARRGGSTRCVEFVVRGVAVRSRHVRRVRGGARRHRDRRGVCAGSARNNGRSDDRAARRLMPFSFRSSVTA
jgi:hypothetical protein